MSLIDFLPHMDWPIEREPVPAEPYCPSCEEHLSAGQSECPFCDKPAVDLADSLPAREHQRKVA